MAVDDVRAAREALAQAIGTIPGLAVHSRFPGSLRPPCAVVYRRETRYNATMDGGADVTLAVRVYTSGSNTTGSQDDLDTYFAPTGGYSLKQAIEADPRLGGTVDWLQVSVGEGEVVSDFKGVDYITADLIVEVG